MLLPEFIFISHSELPGGECILSTRPPYFIVRAYKFEGDEPRANFSIKNNLLNDCIKVPGYNILLTYIGTLDFINNAPVLGHNVPAAAKNRFTELLKFYEHERIEGNKSRLKKFAEN